MKKLNRHNSLKYRILRRVQGKGRGAVFICKDFLDLGSRAAVAKALSILARKGTIRRLKPGLYDYPRINPKLGGELAPVYDEVAQAIARKTGSRIQLSGALASNALGLSTQVPAKRVYLTDGLSRTVRVGKQTLIFRHAAPKEMAVTGKTSSLVFQALRYLGSRGVDDRVIKIIREVLPKGDIADLLKNIRYASVWMRSVIEKICKEK